MKIWCLVSNVNGKLVEHASELGLVSRDGYDIVLMDYTTIEIREGDVPMLYSMGKKLELPDAFWVWPTNNDTRALEHLLLDCGVPSICSIAEQNVARSKVATYHRLAREGIRVPKTIVFFNHPDKELIVNTFGYPFVIKPDNGFGGEGVVLIHDQAELEAYFAQLQYGITYMAQEFISTSKGRDVRVVMLKGEPLVSIIRKSGSTEEFRSNIHLGGSAERFEIDEPTKELCRKVAGLFDLKLVGLDLMFGDGEFVLTEVNSFPGLNRKYFDMVADAVIGEYVKEHANA